METNISTFTPRSSVLRPPMCSVTCVLCPDALRAPPFLVEHQARERSAFTLIELLFVIAIISLLAALLAPALKNARDSAKGIVCMNNLRQMGIAVQSYINDNNGFMPLVWDGTQSPAVDPWWFQQIMPYFGEPAGYKYYPNIKTPIGLCPVGSKLQADMGNGSYGYSNSIMDGSGHIQADKVSPNTYLIADRLNPSAVHIGGISTLATWHRGGFYMLYAGGQVMWLAKADPDATGAWLLTGGQ